ncbi:hypothetical protein SAY86_031989 [Trapa natans]|uniref:Protein DA1-like domain-containing protein n=1 Tax=Trapa natans TaxID=22666 RepID=A0AAN7LSA5_TRANT|nr:hypothetical protein SAY86_031989 [Trapa natans]
MLAASLPKGIRQVKAMDWLKNFLKGASSSSSTSILRGEDLGHRQGDSDDDSSSEKEYCFEGNGDVGAINYYPYDGNRYSEYPYYQSEDTGGYHDGGSAWLSSEITREELPFSSINLPPYDGISNYVLQSHRHHFPLDHRACDQYGYNDEENNEQFVNFKGNLWDLQVPWQYNTDYPQNADYEYPKAADHDRFKLPNGWPRSSVICDVCNERVPVDYRGNPQYKEVAVFLQKYCYKHLKDGTSHCFSCERFEPRGVKLIGTSYSDGREICVDCKKSAIMNRQDCQPLIDEVLQFYEDLDMKVWQEDIPIIMLDKYEMNPNSDSVGLTRGIISSFENPFLETMIQERRFGPGNEILGIKEVPFRLAGFKHVKIIKLLNGCPRLYIGRTLAHEMMHAWLHLEGYHPNQENVQGFYGTIPKDMEEGVCQVLAHKWIESKIRTLSSNKSSSSSPELQFDMKLAKHIKHSIESSKDRVYGEGFRIAHRVVCKYGLKGMLNHIRKNGTLPE